MKIRDLPIGTRFRYEFGKSATLVALSPFGARVIYDHAERSVAFVPSTTEEAVAFVTPGRPVAVSDNSDVEVL